MDVSNKILLNAEKCKGQSFYRFWVIKENQQGRGKITPRHTHTQIRVFLICKKGKHSSTVIDRDSMGRVITQTRGRAFQTLDRAF